MVDLTLPTPGPLCYYADPFEAIPVRAGSFVGSVAEGGSVNHAEVRFTPHGTGTHTECYGHIVADPEATILRCLKAFRFRAHVLTATPEARGEDRIITLAAIQDHLPAEGEIDALILRSLPNDLGKHTANYSGTNPPYLEEALGHRLVALGIHHILVDLPSVDKEVDGGKLAFHHAFWQVLPGKAIRKDATITELIFVPDTVPDGPCTVNIAPAAWALDAAPSRIWID